MWLCNGVHEKYQHHFVTKNITIVIKTLKGNNIRETRFCDTLANNNDEMVLKT